MPKVATKQVPLAAFTRQLNDLIEPFGWVVNAHGKDSPAMLLEAEREAVLSIIDHLQHPKASIGNPRSIPDALWRIVQLPDAAVNEFRASNDAKAFASLLLGSTARFWFWHNIAGETFTDAALRELVTESLQTLPAHKHTSAGDVFIDKIDLNHALWFGRKAGRQPSLQGDEILTAARKLFNIL